MLHLIRSDLSHNHGNAENISAQYKGFDSDICVCYHANYGKWFPYTNDEHGTITVHQSADCMKVRPNREWKTMSKGQEEYCRYRLWSRQPRQRG